MNVVYYTSGIPGTGRIVQGISIYNALRRNKVPCDFTIVSSTEQARIADIFSIPHIEIPLEKSDRLDTGAYTGSALYKTLTKLSPDILIVDRLWFTLHYFIDELDCKKIFFSIQVDDRFFSIDLPNETIWFKPEQYDKVLAVEPFDSIVSMERINPVIIRNRDEILPREEALGRLRITGYKPVCLIALNFKEGYFEYLTKKYSHLEDAGYDVIRTTNLGGGGIFPVIDYFNAIDYIICAAGYTQFWEVMYFKKEATFETFPLHFSSMKWRLENCTGYDFDINGADQMAEIISQY